MWIFWIVAYILVAATVFGVEIYATQHVENSPFYHWNEDDDDLALAQILVAVFWPVCMPFYFAAMIAGMFAKHAKSAGRN